MATKSLAVAAVSLSGLLALALLPVLATPVVGDGSCGSAPAIGGPVEVIEATIRQIESGDDYSSRSDGSSASGAYEFIDSSWAGYGGYPRAYLAPPDIQDAKAAELIGSVLADHANDVSVVSVSWYLGHVPPPGSPEWDTVPAPGSGNRLTPFQYQARWMTVYRTKLTGTPASKADAGAPAIPCSSGSQTATLPGGWALPGPRALLDGNPNQFNAPHHDYPAWDWPIPVGTPVYAIRGGTVVSVSGYPYNCAGQTRCEACGLGVGIEDTDGVQWTYCHGSALHVTQGNTVIAGQQILDSGNTGNSTGAHLHIGIRADGFARCPQPLVASLYFSGFGTDPNTLPTTGCVS